MSTLEGSFVGRVCGAQRGLCLFLIILVSIIVRAAYGCLADVVRGGGKLGNEREVRQADFKLPRRHSSRHGRNLGHRALRLGPSGHP